MAAEGAYFDPRVMPQYLHSFQSPSPGAALQSFARQGYAPYGYLMGHNPELITPPAQVPTGSQPVYHLKVTATPVEVPKNIAGGPEYVVTAFPNTRGGTDEATVAGGETCIAHAVPDYDEAAARGITIKPLHYETPGAANKLSGMTMASAARLSTMQNTNVQEHSDAFVHVYAGQQAVDTSTLLQKSTHTGFADHLAAGYADSGPTGYQGAGIPLGGQQLERGYSRSIARPLNPEDFNDENRAKIYNWILPTTAGTNGQYGDQVGPDGSLNQTSGVAGRFSDLKAGFFGAKGQQTGSGENGTGDDVVGNIFTQASVALRGDPKLAEEETPYGTSHIVPSETDEDLGLPKELRPTVVYAGVEHAPPEYAGTKGPLGYKLHAIEVHQYIPLPDKEDPWIIKHQMNPATTAIFGPMPMPFDPSHSGMVAPTFQKTIENHPAPVLSPEVARMFNHELPVISQLENIPGPEEQQEIIHQVE